MIQFDGNDGAERAITMRFVYNSKAPLATATRSIRFGQLSLGTFMARLSIHRSVCIHPSMICWVWPWSLSISQHVQWDKLQAGRASKYCRCAPPWSVFWTLYRVSWLTGAFNLVVWHTYNCTTVRTCLFAYTARKIPDDHDMDWSSTVPRFSFLLLAICVCVLPVLASEASIYSLPLRTIAPHRHTHLTLFLISHQ
jgi:hypothetical protein